MFFDIITKALVLSRDTKIVFRLCEYKHQIYKNYNDHRVLILNRESMPRKRTGRK